MKIKIPNEIISKIEIALKKANQNEIGGILMGQHIDENEFRVVDITIQKQHGTIASFTRIIDEIIRPLKTFFKRNSYKYKTFNYLGEWHSHPSHKANPSLKDIQSMFEILSDKNVGANFAILIIVKLNGINKILLTAYVFLPEGYLYEALIEQEH